LAAALGIPASAQVGIYIGSAPPPLLRYELRGPEPGPAMSGSRGIGLRMGIAMRGWQDAGIVRLMKAHTGTILITITTSKAANA